MSDFYTDFREEIERQGVRNLEYVGQAWFSFCLMHKKRRLKFKGRGRADPAGPVDFTIYVCEECRLATVWRDSSVLSQKWLTHIPSSVSSLTPTLKEDPQERSSKRILWDL